jgi:glycosyltransferase involved in cell wall biosynthesis
MDKERVLFIDLGSYYGGVEGYINGLAGILRPYAEGYAVCSVPKLATELRAQGMKVVCVPPLGPAWFKGLRLLLSCTVVPYLLLRYRIRIVQLNGSFESLLLIPLRLLGRKTIYTMHGPFDIERLSWFRNPELYFPRVLSKLSLRFASQVVCVSEAVGGSARTALPHKKVRVIANWVEPPSSSRRIFSIAQTTRLLFVGRLEEYKGVQFILEAMEQVAGVSLLVVGDGSYRRQLEDAARSMDVRFAGFQSDPSRFYEEATIFINPSLGPEGLPLASLEAMAHGLPCIFSDLPVHREISAGGRAAALFQMGNSESLLQQLEQLVHSEEKRKKYGLSAREQVERSYSLAGAAKHYLQAFGLTQNSDT